MKFSVVIPCHDRLDLLKEAIYTVLEQDWADWELIIFDNASKNELSSYVKQLDDARIIYDRSDEFLPVTDSWNRAINMATGNYITFLGDDDGLTPNYFSRIAQIIQKYEAPELLYSAIYQFVHPGVAPWAQAGYIAEVKNGFFFKEKKEPFMLSPKQVSKALQGSIRLRRNFTFNIQAFVFSREFLSRLKQLGPIFHSPFPDYYIANVALANSKSTLVIPDPLCIAGVSKASVGYTVFNNLEDQFSKLLNTKLIQDPLYNNIKQFLLPGPLYNSNYILTMEHVLKNSRSFEHIKINFHQYRRLQIYSSFVSILNVPYKDIELTQWKCLSIYQKAGYYFLFRTLKLFKINKLYLKLSHFYKEKINSSSHKKSGTHILFRLLRFGKNTKLFARLVGLYSEQRVVIQTFNKKKIDLPYWEQLSFAEKTWSRTLFFFMRFGKTKFLSRLTQFYIERRVKTHAFQAITRDCNKTNYRKLVEIFDDLHTGSLK